jgi:hypothetical protein
MMAGSKKDPSPTLPEVDAIRHNETCKKTPTEKPYDFDAEDPSKAR